MWYVEDVGDVILMSLYIMLVYVEDVEDSSKYT